MNTVDSTILSLGCAVLLLILTRRVAIPYPSILVLGGLAVAMIPGMPVVAIQPSAALSIFLPGVLFQEASRITWRDVRSNALSIGVIAPVLIVSTCAAVAAVAMALFPGIPLAVAIVIGAVIAPADSMASKAVLARLKVPRRTISTLIGEGLINDAVAVVIYKMAVAAVLGSFVSIGAAAGVFSLLAVGGIGFGIVAGWLGARLLRVCAEPAIYSLAGMALAFLTYAAADAVGVSGALATVVAGVMCSIGTGTVSAELRFNATIGWQLVTFALNAVGFLLIGVQLPGVFADLEYYSTWDLIGYALAICATLLAVRLLIVMAIAGIGRLLRGARTHSRHSWREDVVIGWSGMRGLVSLAAALALPPTPEGSVFPYRDLTLFLAFAAILFTLVGQGLSLAAIVRLLGVGNDDVEAEKRSARYRAAEAALAILDQPRVADGSDTAELAAVRAEYLSRIARLGDPARPAISQGMEDGISRLRFKTIEAERQCLLGLARNHEVTDDVLQELLEELDVTEVAATRRDAV